MHWAGHSLGGALATLAALELKQELVRGGRQEVEVQCYSFGAPRTGNHAFAREYNKLVPDTWSIINDQVGDRRVMQGQPVTTTCSQLWCGCCILSLLKWL